MGLFTERKRSGLRSITPDAVVRNRLAAARVLVKGLLPASHSIGESHYGRFSLGEPFVNRSKNESSGFDARFGGFGVYHSGKPAVVVEVREYGKPIIHVEPAHRALGGAISKAFKRDAGFMFSPKVKVQSGISTVAELLAPGEDARQAARIKAFSDRIARELSTKPKK